MKIRDHLMAYRLRFKMWREGISIKHLTNEQIIEKWLLQRIRFEFRQFGYNLDNLTDADLRIKINAAGKWMARMGMTAKEAADGLTPNEPIITEE